MFSRLFGRRERRTEHGPRKLTEEEREALEERGLIPLDITYVVNNEARQSRAWIDEDVYVDLPTRAVARLIDGLGTTFSESAMPNDVDVVVEVAHLIRTTRRSSFRDDSPINTFALSMLLSMLSEVQDGRQSPRNKPSVDEAIRLYREEGLRAITPQSAIAQDVALVSLHRLEERDWRELRSVPDPIVDMAVDLLADYVAGKREYNFEEALHVYKNFAMKVLVEYDRQRDTAKSDTAEKPSEPAK